MFVLSAVPILGVVAGVATAAATAFAWYRYETPRPAPSPQSLLETKAPEKPFNWEITAGNPEAGDFLTGYSQKEIDALEKSGKKELKHLHKSLKKFTFGKHKVEDLAKGYIGQMRKQMGAVVEAQELVNFFDQFVDNIQKINEKVSYKEEGGKVFVTIDLGPNNKKTFEHKGKKEDEAVQEQIGKIITDDVLSKLPPAMAKKIRDEAEGKKSATFKQGLQAAIAGRPGAKAVLGKLAKCKHAGAAAEALCPNSVAPKLSDIQALLPAGIDAAMVFAIALNADMVRKGIALSKRSEELFHLAEQAKGPEKKQLTAKAEKMQRQSLGMMVKGMGGFVGASATTGAGIAAFCTMATSSAAAAVAPLTIVGASCGALVGGINFALSIRGMYKAMKKKQLFEQLMFDFVTMYGKYPGGATDETRLALEILRDKIAQQDRKFINNELGAMGAAATVGASLCVIGVALGAETYGAGTAIFAALAVTCICAKISYDGYKKYEYKHLQKQLDAAGATMET
ncbi:MAG: hypothetical protein KDK65_02735, partial [Chlamydiia bacterium]|nr:hypothetical protein [Chlamydiia bacterium]